MNRLPYRSIQQINPSRVVIDIFGVTSNTNWITQLSSAKEIKNAYYEQIEDDVFRVIIDLNHAQHWGHSIYYEENKLVIRVNRQPTGIEFSEIKNSRRCRSWRREYRSRRYFRHHCGEGLHTENCERIRKSPEERKIKSVHDKRKRHNVEYGRKNADDKGTVA